MPGTEDGNRPVIVWFAQDLRLADHPALTAAVQQERPIIPLYVLDDEASGPWAAGGASRWWLHYSLQALAADLAQRGSRLILRRGNATTIIAELVQELGATAVFCTRRYEPCASADERKLKNHLSQRGFDFRRFGGSLLYEPETVATKDAQPFKVFTPFSKVCLAQRVTSSALPTPAKITTPSQWPASDVLDDWVLTPRTPDWAGGLRECWSPGEAGATRRLDAFVESSLDEYHTSRDRPDCAATSSLSPHLHFGELSPRQVWHRVAPFASTFPGGTEGADSFLRELIWREFSYHMLYHWPTLPEAPFRPGFERFPWRDDEHMLAAWQLGRTGYPLVDAGMRQLWHTGWMHNRVRMVTASFLVKHLLIPWQRGAAWFWDTLVDADLANNSASWQWVSGCGVDAAPYFRIFNPILQGLKFDPDGTYVRRWVPEIALLKTDYIHQPWLAPTSALEDASIRLGENYPEPVVDHAFARRRALEAFATVR